jgi:hypothetical protein
MEAKGEKDRNLGGREECMADEMVEVNSRVDGRKKK